MNTKYLLSAVVALAIGVGLGFYGPELLENEDYEEGEVEYSTHAEEDIEIEETVAVEAPYFTLTRNSETYENTVRFSENLPTGIDYEFELTLPSLWGFPMIKMTDLSATDGGRPPMLVAYTFGSSWRPHTHEFEIRIGWLSMKETIESDNYVEGFEYLGESGDFVYYFRSNADKCQDNQEHAVVCTDEQLAEYEADIQAIEDSFRTTKN